jgi:hypothetical protein
MSIQFFPLSSLSLAFFLFLLPCPHLLYCFTKSFSFTCPFSLPFFSFLHLSHYLLLLLSKLTTSSSSHFPFFPLILFFQFFPLISYFIEFYISSVPLFPFTIPLLIFFYYSSFPVNNSFPIKLLFLIPLPFQ